MAESENNPGNFYSLPVDGELEGETRNAWLKALEDLASSPLPAAAASRDADVEREKKLAQEKQRDAEKLCDDAREKVMSAIGSLSVFTKAHPYLIAPNVFRMWEENMREVIVMMDRERTRSKVEQLPAE